MFKATKLKKRNPIIRMQINLTSCRTSDHYFLLSLYQLLCDSLKTKNVSFTHAQFFWKVNKS